MARHNREGQGEDQHGRRYLIGYQPDWFHQVKVARGLDTGRQITADGFHTEFEIDDYTRWRLMEGLDDIGLTLRHVDQIDEFEKRRAAHKPTTLPAKVANPS